MKIRNVYFYIRKWFFCIAIFFFFCNRPAHSPPTCINLQQIHIHLLREFLLQGDVKLILRSVKLAWCVRRIFVTGRILWLSWIIPLHPGLGSSPLRQDGILFCPTLVGWSPLLPYTNGMEISHCPALTRESPSLSYTNQMESPIVLP